VQVTAVGYAGGTSGSPTYRNIGDHTESFQLIYDPKVVSYEDILEVFWSEHNPFRQGWSTQYQNIAFYENDKQKDALEKYLKRLGHDGRRVETRVEPLMSFTLAEDYHQKHSLRRFPAFLEFLEKHSPGDSWQFTRLATKLNAYLGSNGSCGALGREVSDFELPRSLENSLLDIVCSREGRKGESCPVPARK